MDVDEFGIHRQFEISDDVSQRLFNDIRAAGCRDERPLRTLVGILEIAFADSHVRRPAIAVANALQTLALFLEGTATAQTEIDAE